MFIIYLLEGFAVGFLLTSLAYAFKKNIPNEGFLNVNRIAGCMLILFGVFAIWIGAEKL